MRSSNSNQNLQLISREFRRLSHRFQDHVRHARKSDHLAVDVFQSGVRAGRLLVAAIDGGAFPESTREKHGEWWDRRRGRVPGGPLTVLGEMHWTKDEPPLHETPRYLAAAAEPFSAEQCSSCWMFAIGSWLERAFPERFRHNAGSWDWKQLLTDDEGYPIGKDGKRLTGRWYLNGKPVPKDFEFPKGRGNITFVWRRTKPLVHREDLYDEADWLAHLGIRAEVYADACLILSELIDPGKPADPPLEDELVTLSQVAPLTGLKKRTLERHIKDGRFPQPDFRGGEGRSNKWYWRTLRPALSELYNRILPDRFPGSRII